MLSPEVSVWWLVAVAVFALAIVVMSQWLSAHREERRWRRERDREELRAATERRLAQDHRWGEARLSAYAQFIEIMQQWEMAISEVAFAQEDDEPVDPALIDRMEQLDEQVRPVLARIILLGSPDVQAQCQELVLMYSRGYRDARVGDPILAGGAPGRSVADVLGDAYYGLVDDLRREIGVDPLDDPPVPEPRPASSSRR
jgi:hypothetical protein